MFKILLLFAAACLVPGAVGRASAQSTMFKCLDEKGITHYGEIMPVACAKKEVTEMSKQGRTLRTLDAPLTAEQLKARSDNDAKKMADDQKVAAQRQKDLAILGTFGTEREIDLVRDKDLAQLAQSRKFLENRIVDSDARLKKINNQMEFYVAGKSKTAKTKDGKDSKDGKEVASAVPVQLQADFDRATTDRKNIDLEIARLDTDRKAITARFEIEKDRFRRLKAGMRPGTILDDIGNVLIDAPIPKRVATPAR